MMTHDVMIVLLSLLTTYSDAACPINNCAQCQSCVTPYWNLGQLCNSVCPTNCTDSGCEDTTGYCYECKPGKYGPTCEQDCSLCINRECDLRKCTDGCKDGYVQYNTNTYSYCFPCSSNCIKCSNTTYCIQCEEGFYRGYYRHPISGRGTTQCTQCREPCTQCTSNDQCPEECKYTCIKQECDVSGGCVTTRSTSSTSTMSKTAKITHTSTTKTWTTERVPQQPYTSATKTSVCPNECKDTCDTHGECHTTTASNSKFEDVYYEAFGHGIATGIGILIIVEALAGVVIFFTRRTKCLRTICPTKTTTGSRENHVYVNTQEEAGTMPTSRNRPLHNEVRTNSEIHVTLSEEDVDTNREYVSLGERQPENHYSDLQTNRRDDQ